MKDTKCICKPMDGNNCPYHFPPAQYTIYIKLGENLNAGVTKSIQDKINAHIEGAGGKLVSVDFNERNYYITAILEIANSHKHIDGYVTYVQGIIVGILLCKGIEVI